MLSGRRIDISLREIGLGEQPRMYKPHEQPR